MSAVAWGFVAGWISASGLITVGMLLHYLHYRRAARRAWLDASDSEQFASGCQRFTEAQGI